MAGETDDHCVECGVDRLMETMSERRRLVRGQHARDLDRSTTTAKRATEASAN